MKLNWKMAWVVGLAVCLSGVWYTCRQPNVSDNQSRQETSKRNRRLRPKAVKTQNRTAEQAVRQVMTNVKIPKQIDRWQGFRNADPDRLFSRLNGEDRRLAEALQKDLDDAEFARVAKSAAAALRSKNPEVRELAVEALGWFGAEALPELTPLMADSDENVAQAAISQWEQALADVDGSYDRLSISAAAMGTLSDPDALESISSQFSNAATEYIDDEEDEGKALEKRVEVVQALLDMMDETKEDDTRTRMAMETYEDITGSKWYGADEAEKYLADPDNYEGPDED